MIIKITLLSFQEIEYERVSAAAHTAQQTRHTRRMQRATHIIVSNDIFKNERREQSTRMSRAPLFLRLTQGYANLRGPRLVTSLKMENLQSELCLFRLEQNCSRGAPRRKTELPHLVL